MAVLLASAAALAQDEDRERAAATLESGLREAALYTIGPSDRGRPIALQKESVLRWNNSVNKSVFGNIFLWTKDGRPEVIASIYQFYSPKTDFCAEFQSLSLDPLIVMKDGKEVWTPADPGIALTEFPGAREPAAGKAQRLGEMRKLADQFAAQLSDYSEETYRLRLLPRPLLRYGSPDTDVLDGALFAYTYTTDPELLVMVEARKVEKGYRWMYGLARMNTGELTVTLGDREVWRAERLQHPFLYKDGIYTLFQGLPIPPEKK